MRETYSLLQAIGRVSRRCLSQATFPPRSFRSPKSTPPIASRSDRPAQVHTLLSIFFDYPSDYQVDLFVQHADESATTNNSTYYVSSGSLELDVNAQFSQPVSPPVAITSPSATPPWQSFVSWLNKFGEAFPLWVKLVYLILGIQFLTVGGLWIRRETATKGTGPQHHDAGDRAFLWVDVAYKFLLVSFLTIVAVMGGEVLALFILRFMFLASLNLLSLWDLFVVGFAGSVAVIAYLFRFTLEKIFDLKPIEDE